LENIIRWKSAPVRPHLAKLVVKWRPKGER
jgi:hypothetical protein